MRTLISFLILPFSFTIILVVAGLCFRWFNRLRTGNVLMITGAVLLMWFSSAPGAWLAVAPLENMYEPLNPKEQPAPYIVVLGGGHNHDETLPATARLSASSTRRLTEGIRIHNAIPGSTLILSAGGNRYTTPNAEVMLQVMTELGADLTSVVLSPTPNTTEEEAIAIRNKIGAEQIILVTSARHLPRAVMLFRGQGLDVIPAPADHELNRNQPISFDHFVWSPNNLRKSHMAFHEYVGICWAWIRGKTG